MDDDAEGVHRFAIEQHVELHELARPIRQEFVVERRVAAGDRLELVIEVENDLGERKLPVELDARRIEILHAAIHAAPLLSQVHNAADVLGRHEDPGLDVRLFDPIDFGAVRQQARILDQLHAAIGLVDVVLDIRNRADKIEIELTLQSLAHDFHVQEAEEAAPEAEAQCHRGLRLVMQRGIVQLQFGEGVPELLILLGVGRIESRKDHRLDVAVAREQLHIPMLGVEHRIPRPRLPDPPHVRDQVADLARLQLLGGLVAQLQIADLVHFVEVVAVRAERDLHPGADHAVHDANRGYGATVAVVVGIEDQRTKRGFVVAARRRHPRDHRLEQLRNPSPLLCRDTQDLIRLSADQVVDLLGAFLRLGAGQIDLVEDGYDFQAGVHGQQQIGQRLGLNALRRIHDQNRALAGNQ